MKINLIKKQNKTLKLPHTKQRRMGLIHFMLIVLVYKIVLF